MKKSYFTVLTLLVFSGILWVLPGYSEQSLLLKRFSSALQDIFFKVRYASEARPAWAAKILVIAIDDESSFRLGLRWPWPRTVFASILEELTRKKAAAVGLNFTFTGLEDGKEGSTIALAKAVEDNGRVVVGSTLDEARLLKPTGLLLKAGVRYGYLEKIVDDDFVIRRSYLSRSYRLSSQNEPSFPLELWKAAGGDPSTLSRWTDPDGGYAINYLLKDRDLKAISAWKLLEGRVPESEIAGKIALVGITSSLISEKYQTPLGLMPGLLVHANEWAALEGSRPLRSASTAAAVWIAWFLGAGLLALFLSRRFWLASLSFTASYFLIFLSAQFLFAKDIAAPLYLLLLGPTLALAVGSFANLLYLFLENRGLEHRVLHDKMTGLYTYDYLRLRLDDEWKRCQKLSLPVSIVMTDLDRFKKINDTLGHEVGNQMILRAAAVIRESARGYDVVSRYGGDEFVILLWHANALEADAYRLRLRKMYETMAMKLQEPRLRDSSMSIGVASFDPRVAGPRPRNPQELIELADKDLFEDKESRRLPGQEKR